MAWSAKKTILSSDTVDDTPEVLSAPTNLDDGKAQLQVSCVFPSTPTDDLRVSIYTTLDAKTHAISAVVSAGGSNYEVGDLLTVTGGGPGVGETDAAIFEVATESSGVVQTVTLVSGGDYSYEKPSNPVATTTNGSGTGCTLTVTYQDEVYDKVPVYQFDLAKVDNDTNIVSFNVKDFYRFKVGVVATGSTDTLEVDVFIKTFDTAL
jgi:hypothetical protein